MNILIVDDNPTHRESASEQFVGSGHDITVAATYEEAEALFRPVAGKFRTAFDAVLVDLMLPGPKGAARRETGVGVEMPIGVILALIALQQEVKYIGVLTDTNHHDHPASSCLDFFGRSPFYHEEKVAPCLIDAGQSRICLDNHTFMKQREIGDRWVRYKDWKSFFDFIVNGTKGLKRRR